MKIHLYLSLNPEALIASHLPPEEFGAVPGGRHPEVFARQAMFFDVDPAIQSDYPPFQEIAAAVCLILTDRRAARPIWRSIGCWSMCPSPPWVGFISPPMTVGCSG